MHACISDSGPSWLYPLETDLTYDGKVDIDDICMIALAYGTVPGMPRWNIEADFTADGKVDIDDLTEVAITFGYWVRPWPITFPPGPTIYP